MLQLADLLKKELEKRQVLNRSYSMRSFAQLLEVSPATLSQVLSGKRKLGLKSAKKMVQRLHLSPLEQTKLLGTLDSELSQWQGELTSNEKRKELQEDTFQMISSWQHFAILALCELKEAKSDPRWVAQRLNISVQEANEALGRLEKLGFIEIKKGQMKLLTPPVSASDEIPSSSIKKFHQQLLGLAQIKIEEVPVEEREFASMTMAINRKKLKKAKQMIKDFKREISTILEDGNRDDVYNLSIQLFPLTKRR